MNFRVRIGGNSGDGRGPGVGPAPAAGAFVVSVQWTSGNSYFTMADATTPQGAPLDAGTSAWYVRNVDLVYELCRAALATQRSTHGEKYQGLGVTFEGHTAHVLGAPLTNDQAARVMLPIFG